MHFITFMYEYNFLSKYIATRFGDLESDSIPQIVLVRTLPC